jgi:hypothetical protein
MSGCSSREVRVKSGFVPSYRMGSEGIIMRGIRGFP